VPARRAAGHADACWVEAVACGVRAEPTHGRFRVVDGGRELVGGREPVADGRRHEPVLRERHAERVVALAATGAEPATVDAQNGGQRAVGGLWPREVEPQVRAVGGGILDIPLEADTVRNDQVGGAGREGNAAEQRDESEPQTCFHGCGAELISLRLPVSLFVRA